MGTFRHEADSPKGKRARKLKPVYEDEKEEEESPK